MIFVRRADSDSREIFTIGGTLGSYGPFNTNKTPLALGLIPLFCHNAGDFAILLNSGFKPLAALFLNFLSALTAFMGLYVGLSLASDESAREWIFTLAAGLFLYISLADMVGTLIGARRLYLHGGISSK